MNVLRHLLFGLALALVAMVASPGKGMAHDSAHLSDCPHCASMTADTGKTDAESLKTCQHGAPCSPVALPLDLAPGAPFLPATAATDIDGDARPHASPVRNDPPPPRA